MYLGQVARSFTKQYNLLGYKLTGRRCLAAGKVTVGLASHWPCVTDFSGLSIYALTAYDKQMSTPPTLIVWYDTLYLVLYICPLPAISVR